MADFSYQHHQPLLLPFLIDSAHTPLLPQQAEEMINSASCFLYYHTPDAIPETSTESKSYESSSPLDNAGKAPELGESQMGHSSSVIDKRENRGGSCLISVQSKDAKERKNRKQKRPSGGGLKQIREKKPKADDKKEREACDEPPVGYVHVRARRGQATDSHSLAERVRREKISERMKLLQSLVPGCDKVVGKATMLDEIINYVQSLQYQVEFLSMKLASVNPILHNFGVDFNGHLNHQEKLGSMSHDLQLVPSVNHQTSPFQPKACDVMDTSPFLLHVGEEQRRGFPT